MSWKADPPYESWDQERELELALRRYNARGARLLRWVLGRLPTGGR